MSPGRVARSALLAAWVACVFAPVVAPALAQAEPSKEELQVARTLFGQAMKEEADEHWAAALAKLESVQAIKASPAVRYHIALCEEKLNRLAAALSDYEAARVAARSEGSKEVLAIVDEPIARLTTDVPHVTLAGDVPPVGTRIEVDGRNLSSVGFGVPIPLDPGAHQITVTAPGHAAFVHSLVLVAKADVGVQVRFSPTAPPAPAVVAAPPPERIRRHPERPWAVATTIGAVVFVGGGVGLIVGAGSLLSGHEASCPARDGCGRIGAVHAFDWGGASAVLLGAGLAVTSVVLWTRPGRTTTVGVGPGQLVLGGTFR